MRRLINFVMDLRYYLQRGYSMRAAWYLARNTL